MNIRKQLDELIKQSRFQMGEMFLKQDSNGEWTLQQQMQGANKATYSTEYIDHAIKQIGSTWEMANSNTRDAEMLEIYLNKGNSRYAYNSTQRINILREFGAPFLRE
jgi:hypothetical protein